jgi:hypothetical protein
MMRCASRTASRQERRALPLPLRLNLGARRPEPSASNGSHEGRKRPRKAIDKAALTLPEPRRVRDRDQVHYVTKQPRLICGRCGLKKYLGCAAEIGAAPFQPRMRLPTQPIQRRQLGLECLDPFDSTVGPFGLDGPVVRVSYYEKNRFTHNIHAPMYCAGDPSHRPTGVTVPETGLGVL